LLTPHAEYLALAADEESRRRAYSRILGEADDAGFLSAVRDATNGGLALVGAELKAKLEAQTGRMLQHKKPGRVPADKPTLDTLTGELGF
jgi:hypothetical protein